MKTPPHAFALITKDDGLFKQLQAGHMPKLSHRAAAEQHVRSVGLVLTPIRPSK